MSKRAVLSLMASGLFIFIYHPPDCAFGLPLSAANTTTPAHRPCCCLEGLVVVSLIDDRRQWFESTQGLDMFETPREVTFCGHPISQDDFLIVSALV